MKLGEAFESEDPYNESVSVQESMTFEEGVEDGYYFGLGASAGEQVATVTNCEIKRDFRWRLNPFLEQQLDLNLALTFQFQF